MRYLRQLKTGRIYQWSPYLAKRQDMVPYDQKQAETRLVAMKAQLEDKQAATLAPEEAAAKQAEVDAIMKTAADLTAVENRLYGDDETREKGPEESKAPPVIPGKSAEDKAAEDREATIEADGQVQAIRAMKSKVEVTDYLKREFGIVMDPEIGKLQALKDVAVNNRIDRIFEG